jgi:hypothetical protein
MTQRQYASFPFQHRSILFCREFDRLGLNHVRSKLSPIAIALLFVGACEEPDDGVDNVGAACDAPDECFPDVEERDAIQGEVVCLADVPGGYCTHLCTTDDDCCAVPGECENGLPQVCAPFQSTGMMMCFLTCEDVQDDAEGYCEERAHPSFGCRSTGGGGQNRRVCVP